MAEEYYRKFLLETSDWRSHFQIYEEVTQGYLSTDSDRIVYVSIEKAVNAPDECCSLVVESHKNCKEHILLISSEEAHRMLRKAIRGEPLQKRRYSFATTPGESQQVWSIHEYLGENQGLCLMIAEISDTNERLVHPPWSGIDVTCEHDYRDEYLVEHPYTTWAKKTLERTAIEKRMGL